MNLRLRLRVVFLVLAAWMATFSTSQSSRAAGPWYVAPGGNDGNDCLSSITACATINGALNKPGFVVGDTILVAAGVYTGDGGQVVLLDKNATLSGGWDITFTVQNGASVLDGQGSRRGITVNSGITAIVEHFAVQNCHHWGSWVDGGGIHNDGILTLNNSTVSGNTGGGIYNEGGSVTLNNSTISGNTAYFGGGVVNTLNGNLILNNSTVSANTGTFIGGGIENASSTVTLQNSILSGNRGGNAPDCLGTIGSSGYNLIGSTSGCSFNASSGDLTDVDAHLGLLIGSPGYHPLLLGSPAIDAGNPTGCMGSAGPLTTDQRGATRVGRCDIGAYEYTTPGTAISIYALGGTPQTTPPSFAFRLPLQAAVLDSIGSPVVSATVTFSAPASGVSGIFSDTGTFTTTTVTSESGVAVAAMFTANGLTGNYTVTATLDGVATSADFLLGNVAWYVSLSGNDANNCLTPTTACATINGALNKPGFVAGDTILVAAGVYTGAGGQVVSLDKNATLSGGWNVTFTVQSGISVLDGQGSRRGMVVDSGITAIVEYFAVQNGYITGSGGGINNNGTLILNSSTVSASVASETGGGIYNSGGAVTLNNSTVRDNSVFGNGGGGIYSGGPLILNNSTVSGNGTSNNQYFLGGGIYIDYGTVILNNSTISGNTASGYGSRAGGIYNRMGYVILNNSTVSDNTTEPGFNWGGAGIYNYDGTVTLQNSILGENTASFAPDCSGVIGSAGYNLIGNTSDCTFNSTTGDLTNVDPQLGSLQDNGGSTLTHALLSGSPAIDAGNPAGCRDPLGNFLTTDQRGEPRSDRCDMGAYELQKPVLQQLEVVKDADPDPVRSGEQLTYTIRVTNNYTEALHATITDVLPSHITPSGTFTWTPVISASGGIWQYTFVVTVEVGYSGSLTNVVEATTLEGPTAIYTKTSLAMVSLPPYSPSNPTPADGAKDVPVDPVLTWRGGDPEGNPVTYTVAFGTSNPPPVVAQVVTTTYDPGPLSAGVTYYWIITATDGTSSSTGPAWRFTTTRCFARLNDGLIYPTLQAAIDASTQPTDVIKVAGYCGGVQERNGVVQTVYLSKTLTIRGGYTTTNSFADPPNAFANPTTLDAQGQGRVLFITGNISPSIEGIQITGGDATGLGGGDGNQDSGGGVYVIFSSAAFTANQIFSNTAASGGGVWLRESATALNGNTISSNTAVYGGGLFLDSSPAILNGNTISHNAIDGGYAEGGGLYLRSSAARIHGNTVSDNRVTSEIGEGSGGGIYMNSSDILTFDNNVIISNSVEGKGGGLSSNNGILNLNGNIVSGNTAEDGGGLFLSGSVALNGNIVSDNIAQDYGGGMLLYFCSGTFANNMVLANRAFEGGGIYLMASSPRLIHTTVAYNKHAGIHVTDWGPGSPSTVNLVNTILIGQSVGIRVESSNTAILTATLWGNTEDDWFGTGTIITGTHNYWGDPTFVDPDRGDYHVGPNSAAVDHGIDAGITTDIDGDPRPSGAGYDMGADEYYLPALDIIQWVDPDPVRNGEQLTYTIRVTNHYTEALHATITDVLPSHITPGGILTWTPIISASGGIWQYTFAVTVEVGYSGSLTNVVEVTTLEGPTAIYTKTSTAFAYQPALEVTQLVNPDPVQAGAPLTYTIHVTNTGNVILNGTITDTLPAHVTPTGVQTWSLNNLTPSDVWTKTVVVTVTLGYAGPLTNMVQVTAEEGATGIYTATTQAQVTPALTVTQQANSTTARAGEPLTYTIRITNTGNIALTGIVTDTLPAKVMPTGIQTWTLTNLSPGNVWIQPLVVTSTSGYSGTLINRVQVTTREGASGETQIAVNAISYQVYLPIALK